ncbi:MAG TPA: ribonuclease HII [Acidimicrobiales bacterium]|nr:ribonuclease HII [Acidimicrobiales bacterium]
MTRGPAPTLSVEHELWSRGDRVVVGLDEVGRGAWAGPLSVGAAVLPTDRRVRGVRDSKLLSEETREKLYSRLNTWCVAWSVGHVSNVECDELGMSAALRLAARRALDGLGVTPDRVLVDGPVDFIGDGRTRTIVKGDATCLSIATASVLAKVTRDRMMRAIAPSCDGFAFDSNKGYPSPVHRDALRRLGPTTWHRRSWSFMDDLKGHERYRREPTLFRAL